MSYLAARGKIQGSVDERHLGQVSKDRGYSKQTGTYGNGNEANKTKIGSYNI